MSAAAIVRHLGDHTLSRIRRCGLDGCPQGGWPETAQAIRRIDDEIPRGVGVGDVIDALYRVDHAGRYRYVGPDAEVTR